MPRAILGPGWGPRDICWTTLLGRNSPEPQPCPLRFLGLWENQLIEEVTVKPHGPSDQRAPSTPSHSPCAARLQEHGLGPHSSPVSSRRLTALWGEFSSLRHIFFLILFIMFSKQNRKYKFISSVHDSLAHLLRLYVSGYQSSF